MGNIVKFLQDCPVGITLYSPLFGEVEFCGINGEDTLIVVTPKDGCVRYEFDCYGRFFTQYEEGECLLFPSKDNHDWNRFRPELTLNHPVAVMDDNGNWMMGFYFGEQKAHLVLNGGGEAPHFKHIVPIENFDVATQNFDERWDYGTAITTEVPCVETAISIMDVPNTDDDVPILDDVLQYEEECRMVGIEPLMATAAHED